MSYTPLISGNSTEANNNQVNNALRQINREQTVKVFKNGNNTAIINGKLPYEGGYGNLYYDANGIPNIVIGILPDGTTGLVIAKPGVDVLTLFS